MEGPSQLAQTPGTDPDEAAYHGLPQSPQTGAHNKSEEGLDKMKPIPNLAENKTTSAKAPPSGFSIQASLLVQQQTPVSAKGDLVIQSRKWKRVTCLGAESEQTKEGQVGDREQQGKQEERKMTMTSIHRRGGWTFLKIHQWWCLRVCGTISRDEYGVLELPRFGRRDGSSCSDEAGSASSPIHSFPLGQKKTESEMITIRNRMGYSTMKTVYCSCEGGGREGGLALFWDEDTNITVVSVSPHHIDFIVHSDTEGNWRFTGLYGWFESHFKHYTWAMLDET